MSFQMPAFPERSTPYQGASSPCICPYASYDRQIQAIQSRPHMEVVVLTAIKLLFSDEDETKKLLKFCPFSRCKEVLHATPQALVDHIISCEFSSDEICCVDCKRYKNPARFEKEPAHLEKEPAHSDREPSGRMDLRRPFRKLSSLFQASIRSNHSSASSSRTGSMISAESPRPSRDFASPTLDEASTLPLPPQTHLYELTDTPPRELDGVSIPSEMGEIEAGQVHHLAELAVQAAAAPRHELPGPGLHFPDQRADPHPRQRRTPPSPPPLLTGYTAPMHTLGGEMHGNWTQEGPLSMASGNSFFGNDITESPTDLQPDVSANFSFRGFIPGAISDDSVSPMGSMDVSPSSHQGSGHVAMYANFEPQLHHSPGTVGFSSRTPQQSFLGGSAYMPWGPSESVAPLTVPTPPCHDSQVSGGSGDIVSPVSLRNHNQSQTRTFSGSTSTSTGTLESTGSSSSGAQRLGNLSSQPMPGGRVPITAPMLTIGTSTNPKQGQWRCRYQPCDYQPAGKRRKNWPSYMRKHEKSHEGIRYPCRKCGNMLSRQDNLKTHLKRCKGLFQRMVDSPSPESLQCMHGRGSEAWPPAGAMSTPAEEDIPQVQWF